MDLEQAFIKQTQEQGKVPSKGVGYIIDDSNKELVIVTLKQGVTEKHIREIYPDTHIIWLNEQSANSVNDFIDKVTNQSDEAVRYLHNEMVIKEDGKKGEVNGQVTVGNIPDLDGFLKSLEQYVV